MVTMLLILAVSSELKAFSDFEQEMLIIDEGYSKHPYIDSDGSTAIGIGRNLSSIGISFDEAKYLLWLDMKRVDRELSNDPKIGPIYSNLDDNRKIALRNMCFNLGITKLRGFKRMIEALSVGDYGKAADEAKESKWYRDVKSRGDRIVYIIRYGSLKKYEEIL